MSVFIVVSFFLWSRSVERNKIRDENKAIPRTLCFGRKRRREKVQLQRSILPHSITPEDKVSIFTSLRTISRKNERARPDYPRSRRLTGRRRVESLGKSNRSSSIVMNRSVIRLIPQHSRIIFHRVRAVFGTAVARTLERFPWKTQKCVFARAQCPRDPLLSPPLAIDERDHRQSEIPKIPVAVLASGNLRECGARAVDDSEAHQREEHTD